MEVPVGELSDMGTHDLTGPHDSLPRSRHTGNPWDACYLFNERCAGQLNDFAYHGIARDVQLGLHVATNLSHRFRHKFAHLVDVSRV